MNTENIPSDVLDAIVGFIAPVLHKHAAASGERFDLDAFLADARALLADNADDPLSGFEYTHAMIARYAEIFSGQRHNANDVFPLIAG